MSYFKVLWVDSGAPAASPLGLSRSRSRRPTEAAGVSRADGAGQQDGALTRPIYGRGLRRRGGRVLTHGPLLGPEGLTTGQL